MITTITIPTKDPIIAPISGPEGVEVLAISTNKGQ